jgi:hypothetical protein
VDFDNVYRKERALTRKLQKNVIHLDFLGKMIVAIENEILNI